VYSTLLLNGRLRIMFHVLVSLSLRIPSASSLSLSLSLSGKAPLWRLMNANSLFATGCRVAFAALNIMEFLEKLFPQIRVAHLYNSVKSIFCLRRGWRGCKYHRMQRLSNLWYEFFYFAHGTTDCQQTMWWHIGLYHGPISVISCVSSTRGS